MIFGFPSWIVIGVGMFACVVMLMTMLANLYGKAALNEALVVYGFRGPRIIIGSGTVIFPVFENFRVLSLELMSFDVAPQQDLYTNQGVAVTVEAVAQLKVRSDTVSVRTASEQFLSKTPQQRDGLIRLAMEGHLRGIIGQLTVEQIVKEPEMLAGPIRATSPPDVNNQRRQAYPLPTPQVRDHNTQ